MSSVATRTINIVPRNKSKMKKSGKMPKKTRKGNCETPL